MNSSVTMRNDIYNGNRTKHIPEYGHLQYVSTYYTFGYLSIANLNVNSNMPDMVIAIGFSYFKK